MKRVVGVIVVLVLGGCAGDGGDARVAEVAARGAEVMPFDLERTTHRFAATDVGGVQTVVADDPRDAAQVALVRQHLRLEADRFRAGDLGDPAAIHGHDMPGLATLEAHADSFAISYREVEAGGRITFETDDPVLVSALHDWFEAQLADHGAHAE
jgi:hypothetical protein